MELEEALLEYRKTLKQLKELTMPDSKFDNYSLFDENPLFDDEDPKIKRILKNV